MDLYVVVIEHESRRKELYTYAESEEEAGMKFHRYIVCQWIGYPWDDPESLLAGTFDKLENGATL